MAEINFSGGWGQGGLAKQAILPTNGIIYRQKRDLIDNLAKPRGACPPPPPQPPPPPTAISATEILIGIYLI